MKRRSGLIVLALVVVGGAVLVCACVAVFGALYFLLPRSSPTVISTNPVATGAPVATLAPVATVPVVPQTVDAACAQRLDSDVLTSESESAGEGTGNDQTLVTYQVRGDSLSSPDFTQVASDLTGFQQDLTDQKKIWDLFTAIIPADQRSEVTSFEIFTDGKGGDLGSVLQSDDPRDWILQMDIQDSGNFTDTSTTLVHEFGHLLTLNDSQITTDIPVFNNPDSQSIFEQEAASCPDYFTFEGCTHSDSYLNRFVQRFWSPILAEWQTFQWETNQDQLDQDTYDFYNKYSDQFVSEYAATSPEEDIAESWMFFIFGPKPADTSIANEKVLFFYDFPELVSLRAQILGPLCVASQQP